jgi:hypothetical protein
MLVFLKPLIGTGPDGRSQHPDDGRAAADQDRQRRHKVADDGHHKTIRAQSNPKPHSPLKPRTTKRTTNKAAKA